MSSTTGLVIEHARDIGAHALVRGVRDEGDALAETRMAWANEQLAPELPTPLDLEHVLLEARHGAPEAVDWLADIEQNTFLWILAYLHTGIEGRLNELRAMLWRVRAAREALEAGAEGGDAQLVLPFEPRTPVG